MEGNDIRVNRITISVYTYINSVYSDLDILENLEKPVNLKLFLKTLKKP